MSTGISPGGRTDVMLLFYIFGGTSWDQEAKTPKIAEVGNGEDSRREHQVAGAAGIFVGGYTLFFSNIAMEK